MNFKSHRLEGILLALACIGLIPSIASSADADFVGTWKGKVKVEVTTTPVGQGNSQNQATVTDENGGTRTINIVPDAAIPDGGFRPFSNSRNNGLTRQRTSQSGPTHMETYKVILKIKADKNGKLSGSFQMANNQPLVAQEWNIYGNKLTFTTVGPKGTTLYSFNAVLNDKELSVRQTPTRAAYDVREFTLKR